MAEKGEETIPNESDHKEDITNHCSTESKHTTANSCDETSIENNHSEVKPVPPGMSANGVGDAEGAKSDEMQKQDDSGIALDPSPNKTAEAATEENCTGKDCQLSPSEAYAGCSDSHEQDESSQDPTLRALEDMQVELEQVVASDSDSSIEIAVVKRLAAKRHRNQSDSSQSDHTDEHEASEDEHSEDDDEEDEEGDGHARRKRRSSSSEDELMDFESDSPAKDPWRPMLELRQREMGSSNHISMPYMFRTRTGASIHLVQRLEMYAKMEGHDGCVNALHFNRSGTLLSSGSDDLSITVWDWMNKKQAFTFESGHRSNVFQCKFMPYSGDCHLVSCARDGQVRLAELSAMQTCKTTRKLASHRGAAHKLALLEDSSHVFYSCGEDAAMFEIDLRQEKPNKLGFTKESDRKVALYSIHANPFKSYEYCVGGRDHFLRVYDKRMINEENQQDGVLKKFCPAHLVDSEIKANVTCAVYNHDGTEVLGTYNDEDIYLFDNYHSDGASYVHKYFGHRNNQTVKGVNFYGPKSEFIVSGSDCSNIFLWDKESENVVQYFHGDDGGVVNVLEPHPHSPILATSGLDHDVKIWLPTAKKPTNLEGLNRVMRRNRKERKDERMNEPEMIDSRMLWILMQNLRRSARRRARQEGEDLSSASDSDSEASEDSEENMPGGCVPS